MTKTVERQGIKVPPGMSIPEAESDVTRRRFLIGAGGMLLLAPYGCGSDGGSQEGASGNTRTIEHPGGTSEVPMQPDRVVAISEVVAGHLASVGLLPVAANQPVVEDEWLRLYSELLDPGLDLSTIQSIGTSEEPNLEEIASIGPELIVTETYTDESLWERLAEIAPTVIVFRGDLERYGEVEETNGAWKQAFDQTVRAAGRQDEAEQVRQRYREVVAEVRVEVSSSVTVTFLRADDSGNFRIDGAEGFGGSVAEEAGITLSDLPSGGEEEGGYVAFSLERLADVVTGDVIVTTTQAEGPSSIEEIEQSPLWERLPAVQAGRIVRLPISIYNGGTYVAAQLLLREIQQALR